MISTLIFLLSILCFSSLAQAAEPCIKHSLQVPPGEPAPPAAIGGNQWNACHTVENEAVQPQHLAPSARDGSLHYAADAGSTDDYAATLSPAPASYVTGASYRFKANTANTGAATVNFNSLGAKTIKKRSGNVTTDLVTGDICAGSIVDLVYDGTNMQMQSPACNASVKSITFSVGFDNGPALADTDDQLSVWRNNIGPMTITEVWCATDSGTATINLQRDDGTPADILSSNLVCTTSGATGTIAGAEDNLAVGDKLDFVMVEAATSGAPKRVTVSVKAVLD